MYSGDIAVHQHRATAAPAHYLYLSSCLSLVILSYFCEDIQTLLAHCLRGTRQREQVRMSQIALGRAGGGEFVVLRIKRSKIAFCS
jgi:hypothetical protein